MPVLIGALAAVIIDVATRGSVVAAISSGLFAAAATYLFLPVLAADFVGLCPNGTTGFLLIDSRTKKATCFEQSGATEIAAQNAILGKIAEKRGWSATLPILYNIGDRATYLAVLKDGAGNTKGVGLMPVDDRNLVVVADDLARGLLACTQALAGQGNTGADPAEPRVVVDGTVGRMATEVVDGNTVYWLTFAERPGQRDKSARAAGCAHPTRRYAARGRAGGRGRRADRA